ncbi:hypothetical protein E3N88_18448 [Mikania micrantha]|uniref:Expansin-like EG45 domain-containing protein n=1 Tax=Mikania micrantha TaxID=192012 RepID=A0A5N6NKI5_9ASTR|nr:hypothetical protein E3N88_18448 [Mikania micrantha]
MVFVTYNLSGSRLYNNCIAQIRVASLWWFATVVFQCSEISGAPLTHATSSHWLPATATWYGSPEGDGSDGGACGYGSLVDVKPFRARVGAVSPILFKGGAGCGACYKVKCLDKSICSRRAVTVIITDECPGGYCSGGNTHFDLSGAAFGRMAVAGDHNQLRDRGLLNIVYRRTPCKYPGRNIAFHVNEGSTNYWLSLLVEFEGGDGDVGSMHIREIAKQTKPNGTMAERAESKSTYPIPIKGKVKGHLMKAKSSDQMIRSEPQDKRRCKSTFVQRWPEQVYLRETPRKQEA